MSLESTFKKMTEKRKASPRMIVTVNYPGRFNSMTIEYTRFYDLDTGNFYARRQDRNPAVEVSTVTFDSFEDERARCEIDPLDIINWMD